MLSPKELQELLQSGQPQAVLDAFATPEESPHSFRQLLLLFDANWALGHLSVALAHLERASQLQPEDARTLDRFVLAHRQTGDERWEPQQLTPDLEQRRGEPRLNRAADMLVRLRDLHGCEELLTTAAQRAPLSPRLKLRLARVKYLQGAFDHSESIATGLHDTDVGAAADRLLRTIAFRRGEFDLVLATDLTSLTDFDHLRYNALLATGAIEDAFAMMPFSSDFDALCDVFAVASRQMNPAPQGTLGIVSESGPGDQLLDLVALRRSPSNGAATFMTVDPRIESLVSRSIRDVSFVPAPKLDRARLGHLHEGHDRETGALVDLLTTSSFDVLSRCDQVVLGRSLKSSLGPSTSFHTEPRLQPREHLVQETAALAQHKIGLCWRSEKQTASRNIHYFDVAEFEELFSTGHRYVCLQHDVTEQERTKLHQIAQGRIDFVDDIDLRDDFETTAALLSNLDCLLGPSTTTTVLGALVGTPALVLHPTHFGTWLAREPSGYWLQKRYHLACSYPMTRRELIHVACETLTSRFPLRAD